MEFPRIDPRVRYRTVGQLRRLDLDQLKADTTLVLENEIPVAVVLPYGTFLDLQKAVHAFKSAVEENRVIAGVGQ